MQLNQAQSEEELQNIVADETAINFLQECGITTSVSVSNHSNTKAVSHSCFCFQDGDQTDRCPLYHGL